MKNYNIINNFSFSYHKNEKNAKRLSKNWKYIYFGLLILIGLISFFYVGFQFAPNGFNIFVKNMNEIFSFRNEISSYPSYSLISLSIHYIFMSLRLVIVGTTLGFLLAIITAILANKNFFKFKDLSRILFVIITLLRCLPSLFFVIFFNASFPRELALILIIFWFSWLWLHKYFVDMFKTMNYSYFYQLKYEGNSLFICIYKGIIPQLRNKLIGYYFQSIESNIRWCTIISASGYIGIGELIGIAIYNNEYQALGIPIFLTIGFMLLFELFFLFIKNVVLKPRSYLREKRKYYFFKYLKYLLIFLVVIANIVCFSLITIKENISPNFSMVNALIYPNFSIINNFWELIGDIFMLISQSITIIFMTVILSLIWITISCVKLFKYFGIVGNMIVTFLRNVPGLIILIMINPIYVNTSSTICIILAINYSTIVARNINESINKINNNYIMNLELEGYSKLFILFKYLFPMVRKDIFFQIIFSIENSYRDILVYGSYGVSIIGNYIIMYAEKSQFNNMSAFIWISLLIISIIAIFNYFSLKIVSNGLFKYLNKVKNKTNLKYFKLVKYVKNSLMEYKYNLK